MKSSEQKAIVKDMQLASLEVLRKTARDVFEEKIMLSTLSGNVIGTTDCESNSVMDCTDLDNTNGGNSHGDVDLLKIDEKDLVLGRVIGRGAFWSTNVAFISKTCSMLLLTEGAISEQSTTYGSAM